MQTLPQTTYALKEWQIAVQALEQGDTILLLRKGGIREDKGQFRVTYEPVLLYPTYEHQKSHLLKQGYANQVEPVASGWHPVTVRISSWARITAMFEISDAAMVTALQPFHIWHQQFVTERLNWKPNQPISALLLRVYRIEPCDLPYRSQYGGCRSWIDLESAIALDDRNPALSDTAYAEQVAKIESLA